MGPTSTGFDSDSHFDSHGDEQHRTIVDGVGRKGLRTRTRWTEADDSGRAEPDLKSASLYREWGFESLPGHQFRS